MNLSALKEQSLESINALSTPADLEGLRVKLLGKNGEITGLLKTLGTLPPEERKSFGGEVNAVRDTVTKALAARKEKLDAIALEEKLKSETLDITLPATPTTTGKIHPISYVMEELETVMERIGFTTVQGPEMETDFFNFTALNIPENHPARQDHDTFYLKKKDENGERMVLRTQTSNAQIHSMMEHGAPLRVMSVGRVYRCDSDMTHTPQFHQMEALCVDKNITFANMKGVLHRFLTEFFERDIKMRMRPAYFPFVEPGAEIDIEWTYTAADGTEKTRWLEILGCGMVHRNVLKNAGVDPEEYQGFAFGVGVDRLTMLKYGVNDLRTMFEGNIPFTQHFGMDAAKVRK
ncbi:MAG: phenylalanine--tRNA ligase subunit alpha [Pseudomonadota bacterium]|nr:phenylalanine--tRNA ligase subunit alpha [Pseudomonadota bacterium]